MTKDPVCGVRVDERTAPARSLYQGTMYYFCTSGCKAEFERNPQKYLGKREANAAR